MPQLAPSSGQSSLTRAAEPCTPAILEAIELLPGPDCAITIRTTLAERGAAATTERGAATTTAMLKDWGPRPNCTKRFSDNPMRCESRRSCSRGSISGLQAQLGAVIVQWSRVVRTYTHSASARR
mmetsp:Transcript_8751/g.19445  ORF Transcript_8751/g.19445 Transcript_8751/m.19445 type:complete len:125 (-) Transcript_8751:313-687(-)